jgi:hypothetical protein
MPSLSRGKLQAPSTKLQRSTKLQAPTPAYGRGSFPVGQRAFDTVIGPWKVGSWGWSLKLLWGLVFGPCLSEGSVPEFRNPTPRAGRLARRAGARPRSHRPETADETGLGWSDSCSPGLTPLEGARSLEFGAFLDLDVWGLVLLRGLVFGAWSFARRVRLGRPKFLNSGTDPSAGFSAAGLALG